MKESVKNTIVPRRSIQSRCPIIDHAHDVGVAVSVGEPHRRAAVAHRPIDVCTHLKEQFDDAGVPMVRGAVQRCRARQSGRVHNGPRPEEQLGEVVVADPAKRFANCCNTTLSSAARATYGLCSVGSSSCYRPLLSLRAAPSSTPTAYVALRRLCAPCDEEREVTSDMFHSDRPDRRRRAMSQPTTTAVAPTYGPPSVFELQQVPVPSVAADQLVRVRATCVNLAGEAALGT